jgi:predicted cupin superfamily sugar epimerase
MLKAMQSAAYWINHLELKKHPEGGFYKETYRSKGVIRRDSLPEQFSGTRNFSTSIYFLLQSHDRSCFHRIKSDELWHFHTGSSLTIYVLNQQGISAHLLGMDATRGESLQIVIPANCWFGALVNEPESYVLSGCTVSPGFDFHDFEIANREALQEQHPAHADIIQLLTLS